MRKYIVFLILFAGAWCFMPLKSRAASSSSHQDLVYVGAYTQKGGKGIYAYRFDSGSGKITEIGLAAATVNPSFLAISPNGQNLYAVNEVDEFKGQKSGAVSAFSIDASTGKLKFVNQVASRGGAPAYICVDKTGKYALVANYNGGNVAVFPIEPDGSLGAPSSFVQDKGHSVNPVRQTKPYAHFINVSPDDRYAITADLGLDKLLVFHFDHGKLIPDNPPFASIKPGSGPRHFTFSPDGKFLYLESEMGSSLTAFAYDAANGSLRAIQSVSSLPPDFKGKSTGAEVQILPSGRFLYASNRGSDTIAVFAVNRRTGMLKSVGYVPSGGRTPRMIAVDPSGRYLFSANQDSNNVVLFRINQQTGKLTPTGEQLKLSMPVCVVFLPRH